MSLVEVTGREERDLIPITASIPVDSSCWWTGASASAAGIVVRWKEKRYIGLADERCILGGEGMCEGKSFSSPVFEPFDLLFPPSSFLFSTCSLLFIQGRTIRGGRKGRQEEKRRRGVWWTEIPWQRDDC